MLITIIRQVGTANAFIPILLDLKERGLPFKIFCLRTHGSYPVILRAGLEAEEVLDFFEAKPKMENLVKRGGPHALMSGTSGEIDDNSAFWSWAKSVGIKSFAFVDQWGGLMERFTSIPPATALDRLPDQVLVIDELMKNFYRNLGLPQHCIEIVGNPAFDELIKKRTQSPRPLCVLFASEPYAEAFPDSPINEVTLLELLAKTCEQLGIKELLVRPHPRESFEVLNERCSRIARENKISIALDQGSKALVLERASHVIGIESTLVLESCLVGAKAGCFLPPQDPGSLFLEALPEIATLRTPQDLKIFLSSMDASAPDASALGEYALPSTPRFCAVLSKFFGP